MKNSYIGQASLVLMLAVIFGALLAGVQAGLAGRIDANKVGETMDQIPTLVPGAVASATEEVQMGEFLAYHAFDADGNELGWVIKAVGQGFAGPIEVLVGYNADATELTGVYVLSQNETPALGSNITQDYFLGEFTDPVRPTDVTLEAVKVPTDGAAGEIRAVTGATISSNAVCSILNGANEQFRTALIAWRAEQATNGGEE
jgi:electron transport complex protein RnfG